MKRLLALLAVAAACVGLLAAPASAERVTGRDARADVAREDADDLAMTRVRRPSVDVVRYVLRYDERRFTAELHLADLRPVGRRFTVAAFLTSPSWRESGSVPLVVTANRANRAGSSRLLGAPSCRTTHRIDYRRDLVRVSMPARCLATPRVLDVSLLTHVAVGERAWFYDVAPGGYRRLADEDDDEGRYIRVRRGEVSR
ncbi:hypothetical protein GCM10023340_18300 [Nocardioides marinquilinus]|uniref:Uncharacterized protein n=1 Tax=Nocardioides marinquilinus TaxID=1210400 RepID=A0ABP9PI09_9ACTN